MGTDLVFHIEFDGEQGGDEQQKHDQNAVTSFVFALVQAGILAIHHDCRDDETNQENARENELAL